MNKQQVLFLCTHNSARSQMAEGFLRSLAGDRFEVASAGTEATRVHPLAIRAMADISIDLSGHTSKIVEFVQQPWDYVITVCDAANEACLVFPKKSSRLHWSFEDPEHNSIELCGLPAKFPEVDGPFLDESVAALHGLRRLVIQAERGVRQLRDARALLGVDVERLLGERERRRALLE